MVIVMCKGGLGNQMFQYALYRKYVALGIEARISIHHYYQEEGMMPYVLPEVFPNIELRYLENDEIREEFLEKNNNRSLSRKIIEKINPRLCCYAVEKKEMHFSPRYLEYKNAVVDGYWQTDKYWNDIKSIIKNEFEFAPVNDENFIKFKEFIITHTCTSVHVRRGDYLKEGNSKLFGNICTRDYYTNAMNYIEKKEKQDYYVIFTDDKLWVKKHFSAQNVVFASDFLKGEYPDWYEMCLQSCCENNIIANSTFSWWAAYLNKNPKKIIVAPKIWINGKKNTDILPSTWVSI